MARFSQRRIQEAILEGASQNELHFNSSMPSIHPSPFGIRTINSQRIHHGKLGQFSKGMSSLETLLHGNLIVGQVTELVMGN